MISENFVDGEVWINKKITYARFSPYICQHGIWLHNRVNSWGGPHIEIKITPDRLSQILATNNANIAISFVGSWLGKIDELSGYAACDEGTHTRRILSMTMRIQRKNDHTKFEFEGETDYLDPKSVRSKEQNDLTSRGRYLFRVWFKIMDGDIIKYFKDKLAIESINAYTARVYANKHG